MQKLISKYGLAAHLALVAVAPQFFSLSTVLCLAALSFCWLIFEPSRIGGESLHVARRRVASAVISDPVFWMSIVIFAYSAVRFFNTGIGMQYDSESETWMLSQAFFSTLPGSVAGHGSAELAASAALIVVLQGCRNAMGRKARGAFMLLYSGLAGAGGAVCCVLSSMGLKSVASMSLRSFADPFYLGVFHGVALVCAVTAFSTLLYNRWYKALIFSLVAVVGNAAGLFVFSPPAVSLVFFSLVAFLCVYAIFWHYYSETQAQGLVYLIGIVFFIMAAGLLSMVALSPAVLSDKIAPFIGKASFLPENFKALHSALSDVSLLIWKKCPWLGAGLGSFSDAVKFAAPEGFWEVVSPSQATPLSLHWLILAERGAIGAFVIVTIVSLLMYTYFRRWISSIRSLPQPAALSGILLLGVCVVDALFDVSLLTSGAYTCFLIILSVSASTFAKAKNNG